MTEFPALTCGDCESFHEAGEGESWGTCWRFPPTAIAIPVAPPSNAIATPGGGQGATIPGGVMTLAVRPPVQPDTLACGEWDDGKHGNLIEPTSDGA